MQQAPPPEREGEAGSWSQQLQAAYLRLASRAGDRAGVSIFSTRIPWDVRGSLRPREHLPTAARIQPTMESLSNGLKKKATEQHYRAEVMIAGEQLR